MITLSKSASTLLINAPKWVECVRTKALYGPIEDASNEKPKGHQVNRIDGASRGPWNGEVAKDQ